MDGFPCPRYDQFQSRTHIVRLQQFRRCDPQPSAITPVPYESDSQSFTNTGTPSSSKFIKTVSNNAPATYSPESISNVKDPYLLSFGILVVGNSLSRQIPFGSEAIETSYSQIVSPTKRAIRTRN